MENAIKPIICDINITCHLVIRVKIIRLRKPKIRIVDKFEYNNAKYHFYRELDFPIISEYITIPFMKNILYKNFEKLKRGDGNCPYSKLFTETRLDGKSIYDLVKEKGEKYCKDFSLRSKDEIMKMIREERPNEIKYINDIDNDILSEMECFQPLEIYWFYEKGLPYIEALSYK